MGMIRLRLHTVTGGVFDDDVRGVVIEDGIMQIERAGGWVDTIDATRLQAVFVDDRRLTRDDLIQYEKKG